MVLMDLGSALLSAETALELLDPEVAAKVVLCAAPLVEGTLAAVVAANAGASLEQVLAEAQGALQAKQAQLGEAIPASKPL
ncbi:PTS-dependent dihydroxyacetone kinase, phosphotransferase subunit dhaM [Serratia fonticola]|uniref:PTS-dependent dihydroxyacetone kinase, phosphotransferase subunit dhaM n=1 Tax=Serratia fonticola TaxID=47917 RepID=A0A4U9W6T7_SERFO|nr:PTS-dependent dihydroxyacetone kinase, phosphotransferase subunit dhaM [Serratia fonticola]